MKYVSTYIKHNVVSRQKMINMIKCNDFISFYSFYEYFFFTIDLVVLSLLRGDDYYILYSPPSFYMKLCVNAT